jgi:hypothetical protein
VRIGVCGVCGGGCVRWHAGRDGMGWLSPTRHGLLCGSLRWRESVCGLIVWIICVFLVACGDMAGAWDGYLAVDRDGCGRWRVVCGVVGGRAVQLVRKLTAHACMCDWECGVGLCGLAGFGGWQWASVFAVCGYGCV